jgi:hypothetical protein
MLTIRTLARRDAFLRLLGEGCSVAEAAKAIGLGRRTMYDWRGDDEDFGDAWDDAVETITEDIESALARAALGGDSVSQIVWVKAHKPELYNRKQVVAVGGGENAPPVMLAAGPTGPVFILRHNRRDPIPQHMQPPPGSCHPHALSRARWLTTREATKPDARAKLSTASRASRSRGMAEITIREPSVCFLWRTERSGHCRF